METKVTVILNVYKRLDYLHDQLESIRNQTVPVDIWIDYTVPAGEPMYDLTEIAPDAKITTHVNQNFHHIGRFYHALNVQTPYIFIIDDDIIPGINYIQHCLDTMNQVGDSVLTAYGLILNPEIKKYKPIKRLGWHSLLNNSAGFNSPQQVDMAGHSWFFKKTTLKYITYEEPIVQNNGEDLHFSYCCSKYGNLPIIVPSHEKNKPENWSCDVTKGMKYGNDEYATWRRDSHQTLRDSIVQHQINNGWKLLEMHKKRS